MQISRDEALQAYNILGKLLKEVYHIDELPIVRAGIFQSSLSPFSALVTCLYQQGLDEKEIARLVKRNKTFVRQSIVEDKVDNSGKELPLSIFSGKLSVLEAVAVELKKQGLRTGEIAREMGKSSAVVWTLLKRAEKKGGQL